MHKNPLKRYPSTWLLHCVLLCIYFKRRVHTKYFAVFSAGTYYPRALSTDRVHTGINSLREDYANEPLTSLRLLLWVYWQAANNFTVYTATRSPRPEVPGVGDWLQ